MKKVKVIFDMILNIIATTIPTIVLQLLLLPALAVHLTSEEYGLMLTILALLNLVPATIGNMLNNARLLHEQEYKKIKDHGDFQILLIIFEFVNIIITMIASIYYLGLEDILSNVLLVIVAVLWLGREYHIVAFRIVLNYNAIMLNNIFMVIGYCVGYIIFKYSGYWQFIYLLGFITSYIYILTKTNIMFEPVKKTRLFTIVIKDTIYLVIATILARSINYADKILLYPLLGGAMVSIYHVATVFVKVVSLAITPINSVALSYLSKVNKKPDHLFKWTYVVGIIVCTLGYILAIIFSRPILSIIYPKYAEEAIKYIYVTSGTTVISVLSSIINTFVLRYFEIKWQIYINGFTVIFYVLVSILLLKIAGLMGFCVGALLSNIVKLIMTTFVYVKVSAKEINV